MKCENQTDALRGWFQPWSMSSHRRRIVDVSAPFSNGLLAVYLSRLYRRFLPNQPISGAFFLKMVVSKNDALVFIPSTSRRPPGDQVFGTKNCDWTFSSWWVIDLASITKVVVNIWGNPITHACCEVLPQESHPKLQPTFFSRCIFVVDPDFLETKVCENP